MLEQIERIKLTIQEAKGEHKRRIDVCMTCDKLNPKLLVCSECGCPLILKAAWPPQTCPLAKW